MQGKHLFEYAVLRVMPRVEREEFLNVGVILYCAAQNFLQLRSVLNEKKIRAISDDIVIDDVQERLNAFEKICKGGKEGGEIGLLALASRFRWLTANRSTILQSSPVHPGLCDDASETLGRLFSALVS